MRRTGFEVWVVDGPGMNWVYRLKADAQDKMQDLSEDGHESELVRLTEPDPLAPHYKRVALATERYVVAVTEASNTGGDFWTLADAVADLKKARRARR